MAITKKRQKFFEVEMPIINKKTQLRAFEVEELDGRYIRYDLTRLLKGKNIILQLKVKIKGDEAVSTPTEIVLLPSFLKRAVRKGTDYVEDSFSAECNDAQLRIKPFLITRRRVSRKVRKALREKAKEELARYTESKSSEQIFEDVLKNKLQKELSLKLKKIYPLSLCEIRMLKVEKELKKVKKEKEEKKEPETEESEKEAEEKLAKKMAKKKTGEEK